VAVTPGRLLRDRRGAAYLEFLIIIVPFLLLFLGSLQFALIGAAKLVVQHAASTGARAASVVLDDDPARYESEERNLLLENVSSGTGRLQAIANKIEEWVDNARVDAVWNFPHVNRGSTRLSDIRRAAYIPLAALAPQPDIVLGWFGNVLGPSAGESVAGALGNAPETRLLTGLLVYNQAGAAVTFPTAPGAGDLRQDPIHIDPNEKQLALRVTYLFHCGVPLVSQLICRTMWQITGVPDAAQGTLDQVKDIDLDDVLDPQAKLDEIKKGIGASTATFAELSHAELPALQYMLLATKAHFFVVRAEAVVPNQGAAYKYASQLGKKPSGEGAGGFSPPKGNEGGGGKTPQATAKPPVNTSKPAKTPVAKPPVNTAKPGQSASAKPPVATTKPSGPSVAIAKPTPAPAKPTPAKPPTSMPPSSTPTCSGAAVSSIKALGASAAPTCAIAQPATSSTPFSKKSTEALLQASEGQPGPGKNIGHVLKEHIPPKKATDAEVKLMAESVPKKPKNTAFRSHDQGVKALRQVLNDHRAELDALPPDGETQAHGFDKLLVPVQGFESIKGAPATQVEIQEVSWRIARMPDGRLHIINFAPSSSIPKPFF
jgi:hypothetical protein